MMKTIGALSSYDETTLYVRRRVWERFPAAFPTTYEIPIAAIERLDLERDWWAVAGDFLCALATGLLLATPLLRHVGAQPVERATPWLTGIAILIVLWTLLEMLRSPFRNWFLTCQGPDGKENISNDRGRSFADVMAIKDALLILISKSHGNGR